MHIKYHTAGHSCSIISTTRNSSRSSFFLLFTRFLVRIFSFSFLSFYLFRVSFVSSVQLLFKSYRITSSTDIYNLVILQHQCSCLIKRANKNFQNADTRAGYEPNTIRMLLYQLPFIFIDIRIEFKNHLNNFHYILIGFTIFFSNIIQKHG